MWLSSIEVRGLAAEVEASWERVGRMGPAGPTADALALLVGALRHQDAPSMAASLGFGDCEVDDGELTIDVPTAVRRVLAVGPRPQVTVEVTIEPDPPLFGRLRDAVLRDPALADGLGQGTLTVRAGWLFTPDCAFASLDLVGVALGDVPIPLADRPGWVDEVLSEVAGRIGFVDWRDPIQDVADALCGGLVAPDPETRALARRALAATAGEPFGMPLEPILDRHAVLGVGEQLTPLRWAGPEGELVARLVHAVFMERPDVLVLRSPVSDSVRSWLEQQLEGDEATLEQVLVPG